MSMSKVAYIKDGKIGEFIDVNRILVSVQKTQNLNSDKDSGLCLIYGCHRPRNMAKGHLTCGLCHIDREGKASQAIRVAAERLGINIPEPKISYLPPQQYKDFIEEIKIFVAIDRRDDQTLAVYLGIYFAFYSYKFLHQTIKMIRDKKAKGNEKRKDGLFTDKKTWEEILKIAFGLYEEYPEMSSGEVIKQLRCLYANQTEIVLKKASKVAQNTYRQLVVATEVVKIFFESELAIIEKWFKKNPQRIHRHPEVIAKEIQERYKPEVGFKMLVEQVKMKQIEIRGNEVVHDSLWSWAEKKAIEANKSNPIFPNKIKEVAERISKAEGTPISMQIPAVAKVVKAALLARNSKNNIRK